MDYREKDNCIFLRLDPGEELVASITKVTKEHQISAAAIVSGVGMLDGATLGFFDVAKDDYDTKAVAGIYDLSVVIGNVTWREGVPYPHVHVVFNDPQFNTISGHLIEGRCHITMEVFMRRVDELALDRVKLAGCPATRIVLK